MHENHENPFKNIEAYPALSYIASEKEDLPSIEESQIEEENALESIIDSFEIKNNPEIMVTSPEKDE
jgi:hypothetical protein